MVYKKITASIVLGERFNPKIARARLESIASQIVEKFPKIEKDNLEKYLIKAKQIAHSYSDPTKAIKLLDEATFNYLKNNPVYDLLDLITSSTPIKPRTSDDLEIEIDNLTGGSS